MLSVVADIGSEVEIAPTFDDFYALYPRHVARKDAARAWTRLSAADQHAALIGLVEWRRVWEHERSRREDAYDFIPYPATWLNGERWTDELPAGFRRPAVAERVRAEPVVEAPRQALPEHVRAMIAKVRNGRAS